MNCPVESLSVQQISLNEEQLLKLVAGPTTEVAMGCGKAEAFARMCTVPETGTDRQCAWYSVHMLKERDLRKRATFDANCAPDKLALSEIDDSTMGVLGCGQRLSYTWSCPHSARLYSSACHWLLNGSNVPSPAPAGPAAAPAAAPPAPAAPHPTEI